MFVEPLRVFRHLLLVLRQLALALFFGGAQPLLVVRRARLHAVDELEEGGEHDVGGQHAHRRDHRHHQHLADVRGVPAQEVRVDGHGHQVARRQRRHALRAREQQPILHGRGHGAHPLVKALRHQPVGLESGEAAVHAAAAPRRRVGGARRHALRERHVRVRPGHHVVREHAERLRRHHVARRRLQLLEANARILVRLEVALAQELEAREQHVLVAAALLLAVEGAPAHEGGDNNDEDEDGAQQVLGRQRLLEEADVTDGVGLVDDSRLHGRGGRERRQVPRAALDEQLAFLVLHDAEHRHALLRPHLPLLVKVRAYGRRRRCARFRRALTLHLLAQPPLS
mmetsp:Transcript_13964/g.48654  ORF Transcript_13964/g.48654 Transcript_13964/m.48654 type:complete len:341 (-) Transcript_13964:6564-7586(-)